MRVVLLMLLALGQGTETRYENHPTGELRAQYGVRVEPDGSEVRHGAWTGWYPEGEVESEGRYEDGARTGEWTFRWPNGKRKEVGEYRDGLRTGTWREYDERGKRIAQGRYREGHRDGKWTFWDSAGKVDATRSGPYSWQRVELACGVPGRRGPGPRRRRAGPAGARRARLGSAHRRGGRAAGGRCAAGSG